MALQDPPGGAGQQVLTDALRRLRQRYAGIAAAERARSGKGTLGGPDDWSKYFPGLSTPQDLTARLAAIIGPAPAAGSNIDPNTGQPWGTPGGLEYDPRYKTTPFPNMVSAPRVPGQQGASPMYAGGGPDPFAGLRDQNNPPGPVGKGPGFWTYDGWGGFWRNDWVQSPWGWTIKGSTDPKFPGIVAGVS